MTADADNELTRSNSSGQRVVAASTCAHTVEVRVAAEAGDFLSQ